MAKAPRDLPVVGDRVKLRGKHIVRHNRPSEGVLIQHKKDNNWCVVNWDMVGPPKICHLFELEKVDVSNRPI